MMCPRIYTSQPQAASPTLRAWAYLRTCPMPITSNHSPLQTELLIPSHRSKHPMWLTQMHHQRLISVCKNQSRSRCNLLKPHRSPPAQRCHAPAPAEAYHLALVNIRPTMQTQQMRPRRLLHGNRPIYRQTPRRHIQSLRRSVKVLHRGKIEAGTRRHHLPTRLPRKMPSRQQRH